MKERIDDPIYPVARMERGVGSGPIWLSPVAMIAGLAVGTTVGPIWGVVAVVLVVAVQGAWHRKRVAARRANEGAQDGGAVG